jgi:ABC-type transport system involved in cytochrome bd biosynthesis fused ATPase/permease subunit
MDIDTTIVLGVAFLFILNHVLVMLPDWHRKRTAFYGLQFVNFAAACFLAGWGAPGFNDKGMRMVNWVLMALVMYHVVQNNSAYVKKWQGEAPSDEERERLRRKVLSKLVDSVEEPEE